MYIKRKRDKRDKSIIYLIVIYKFILFIYHDNYCLYSLLCVLLGMGIGDWGLGPIPNPQSPIPNPQSPIPNTHNQIYNKYCIQCKLYLCNQCTTHKSHKVISLDNIISTTDIINKVNEGYNHINIYCNELKNKKINNYITKINQLEYSYQTFSIINNDLLHIIMLMVNNYNNNHYNYYLKKNIKNILSFINNNWNKCHDYTNDDIDVLKKKSDTLENIVKNLRTEMINNINGVEGFLTQRYDSIFRSMSSDRS